MWRRIGESKLVKTILFIFATATSLTVATEAGTGVGAEAVAQTKEPRPVIDIAYDLTQKILTPKEWEMFVKKFQSQYEDWGKENDGDMNRFLDDRLLQYLLSIHNEPGTCSEKDLKQLVCWLALYKELPGVFAPSWILKISKEQREEMEKLLNDFSWESLDELIKNPKRKKDETPNSDISESNTKAKVERNN